MGKQARLRTQEMRAARAAAARREARRRRIVMLVGGLVVLGLVAAIAVAFVQASRDSGGGGASGEVVVPANTDEGSIPVGADDAPVTVSVYFDYMCPACGRFEAANGEELDRLVEAGEIRVELRPISFLDRTSMGTEYSTRAANALATAADGSAEDDLAMWAFHQGLFEQQPQEGTPGLDDDQIAEIAREAGVADEVVERFTDMTHEGWVQQVTEDAFDSGVEGTPTVLIDGDEFTGDLYSPGPLTQAIEQAGGGGSS
jgi:protein-disulfide isomerase